MRLFDLMVAGSIGVAIAGCALDESGLIAGPDGAPQGDVRADIELGHDARRSDASAADARKDAPHAGDAKGGDTGTGDAGKGDSAKGETGGGDAADAGSCPTPADCSNPACKSEGYVCAPPAPAGWSLAAVDFTSDVPCPAGHGASYPLVTPPTGGPAICGCGCSPGSSPSCTVGAIDIMYSSPYYGGTSCAFATAWDAADGLCIDTFGSFAPYLQVTSTPRALGGTCDGKTSKTLPASGSTSDYVCPVTGMPSTTGCSGGDVCVAVGSTESACILGPGVASCPATYSVAHPVGTSVSDTRSCAGACLCGAPTATCSDPTWTFYTSTGCKGTSTAVDMNGLCDATTPVFSNAYYSYQYTASPVGTACGPASASPAPTGALSLVGAKTLCCVP